VNKRILVTGCAGFVGYMTSIKFLQSGYKVLGIDDMNDYYSVRLKKWRVKGIERIGQENFDFVEGDISTDVLTKIGEFGQFDGVIHLAAQAGVRFSLEKPERYIQSNILAFDKILSWTREKAIGKFLYASSSSVYGKTSKMPLKETMPCNEPESYYAATKKANEMMAFSKWRSHSMLSLGMRFFTVYGPAGRPDMAPFIFTSKVLKSETIELFNFGKQRRDFTYIDDIVESIFRLYNVYPERVKSAEIVNIGCGSPISLETFVQCLEACSGRKVKVELSPEQPGDVRETYADTQKLDEWIGKWDKVTFAQGLSRTYDWVQTYEHLI